MALDALFGNMGMTSYGKAPAQSDYSSLYGDNVSFHPYQMFGPGTGFGSDGNQISRLSNDVWDWKSVPGYEQFYTSPEGYGENVSGGGVDLQKLLQWQQDTGNYFMNRQTGNGTEMWLQDPQGNYLSKPFTASNDDGPFRNAMWLAAAAVGGGIAAGAVGGGGAGAALGGGGEAAAGEGFYGMGIEDYTGLASGGGSSASEALYGSGGYGAGMTGGETAAFDSNLLGQTGLGVSSGGTMDFNPEGITNPNFGQGADFARVSAANGGGSSLLSNPNSLSGWGSLLQGGIGAYNAYNFSKLGKGPAYASTAQAQLNQLLKDPSSITNLPGYQAGLDAVERKAAGQGYLGSGNLKIALAKYGGDFYNQTVKELSALASGGEQGQQQYRLAGMQLLGQSLNSISYGLSQLGFGG